KSPLPLKWTRMAVAFPEYWMLHQSLGLHGVSTYFIPRPRWLIIPLAAFQWMGLLKLGFISRWMLQAFIRVRVGWLVDKPTPIRITLNAFRNGHSRPQSARFYAEDGVETAAEAIALTCLFTGGRNLQGVYLPDQWTTPDEFFAQAENWFPGKWRLS
ncbi:MAG: hypothetical protein OEW12_03670, partial [Deltaproteobacteria bacterium]|nr:hypothetical protein [Deltaproteobacteria bacterium]